MKNIAYIFPLCAVILIGVYSLKAEKSPLDSELKKISYVLGQQVGMSIKAQNEFTSIDSASLQMAIADVLSGRPALISEEESRTLLKKWHTDQMAARAAEGQANLKKGQDFLEANKTKEGVRSTVSGLQYIVVKEGTGEYPKPEQQVKVHYAGTLIDGTEFDSSYKRGEPATFGLRQVIPGWTEGLQLVKPGGKLKLFIPASLAYGEQDRPSIPANSVLVFDVELLEVLK